MVGAEPGPLSGGGLLLADAAPLEPVPGPVRVALAEAAARGTRIVSICVGAFVLAAAGVPDGRRATTHRHWARELRLRYLRVLLQEEHLFVDEGQVLTSAGLMAGADLCLHMVRNDLGDDAANAVARAGAQTLFIHQTRRWLLRTLNKEHTLRSIARQARISVRTLSRRFQAETGETVMAWLTRQRVSRAGQLIGTSPMAYRRAFRPPVTTRPVTVRSVTTRLVRRWRASCPVRAGRPGPFRRR